MTKQLLGDLEQKIMNILWEETEALKPSEVQTKLQEKYAYTTIMTVLTRLHDKKLLTRCKKGKAYYYSPLECKQTFAEGRLKKLFSTIVSTYKDLAISQFVDAIENNPEELQKLKDYLQEQSDSK